MTPLWKMSRLTERQRKRARTRSAEAALLGYRSRSLVHYTQGSQRWEGIANHCDANKGQFPRFADCSAYTTWCLWNGLYLAFGKPDVVNDFGWRYGNTHSQITHGRQIRYDRDMRKGDLVFYATQGTIPTHVAIMVGRVPGTSKGTPMVISHGQESGPLYLAYNYRRLVQVRRYIHDGI